MAKPREATQGSLTARKRGPLSTWEAGAELSQCRAGQSLRGGIGEKEPRLLTLALCSGCLLKP